jgi:uncharacterized membrane protein YidH (DUF202 family)
MQRLIGSWADSCRAITVGDMLILLGVLVATLAALRYGMRWSKNEVFREALPSILFVWLCIGASCVVVF